MRVALHIALFALLLVGGYVLRTRLLERMIFYPSPGADFEPAELGIAAEEVFFTSEDRVRLHAYFLPAAGATRALLFFHGNAGNASQRLPIAAEFARLGAHVLLLDYRGYGKSEGRPSERGVYADARAALAYLQRERGIPENRIIVYGHSLGGAVAVDLAQDRRLAGTILEGTFTSPSDVARYHYGPLGALFARGTFHSAAKIQRLRCPILFLHGDRDEIVPYELGLKLYAAAPEPKSFETIPGASHNDTSELGGALYYESILRFIDQSVPK